MKIFISPSSQEANAYTTGTSEEAVMNLIADYVCAELTRHKVEWMRNKRENTYAGHVAESDIYKPDIHLAIHSNADNGLTRGCEVFCYDPTNSTSLGTILAKKIYTRISTLTPVTDRGVKAGTMAEVKQVHAPAALVEIDFHDSPEGAKWIVENIKPIGLALTLSILETVGVPYMPPDMLPDKKDFLMGELRKIQVIAMEALR